MKFDDVKVGDVFQIYDGFKGRFVVTYKLGVHLHFIYNDDGQVVRCLEEDWNDPIWQSFLKRVSENKCVIIMVGDEEDLQLSSLCIKRANSSSLKLHEDACKKQHKRQILTAHKEWK